MHTEMISSSTPKMVNIAGQKALVTAPRDFMERQRLRAQLLQGLVIPAHPLALTAQRTLDERRQRALTRYYLAAGSGGLAIGVHTTQFAIRKPEVGLYQPVLALAVETARETNATPVLIAGVVGPTAQALAEARLAYDLGYHAVLLSLGGLDDWTDEALLTHCRVVAQVMPIIGFYLQTAVGGRKLSHAFWREFAGIEEVVGIKIAPFNRYQTLDVMRGVADSGRGNEIALYTGNDDSIVIDLLTPYMFPARDMAASFIQLNMIGGLLGHWAVWTRRVVQLMEQVRALVASDAAIPKTLLATANQITDCNAAFFDAQNDYRGCIAGLHEVLRRQRLLAGTWCLDPLETLSPGQIDEIDRVYRAYPHLNDDTFIAEHLDEWLR